ncbi:hypothetical protein [Chryseobacterium sp. GP-SGM7]|uniref:hypothetical protein n=1 Tax=Chryseobacterium sp. GP-SGM7 TaxID=3411323 RepID=UPI003B95F2F9
MRSFYSYEGYCSSRKLSHFVTIEVFEVIILCVLISYAIFLESFQSFKKHLRFYKVLCVFLLLNSVFLLYQIVENPIVLEAKVSGWSDLPQNHLFMRYNPLITFLGLYSATVIWLNFRFQKKAQNLKMMSGTFLIFVLLSIVTVAIVTHNVEYQACRG